MNTRQGKLDRITEDVSEETFFYNPFEDQMFVCPINNPVITPHGTTYELGHIQTWVDDHKSDPHTRERLKTHQLVPNHLFTTIKELFIQPKLDFKKLDQAFTCPLSKLRFEKPVVAQDGHTYELLYIKAYVEHFGKTPKGKKQKAPFYPNRFVEEMQNLLKDLLSNDNIIPTALIKSLQDYLTLRAEEKRYTGSIFGYSKWSKLEAGAFMLAAATGRISPASFFSDTKKLAALKQGKLDPVAEPIIECLRSAK